ncbi:alpha/beta hydrolase [Rhizobium sp. SEMIA 4085]|uniref:Alpha/beta hydrolase family protein n=1 Tax=Rhizobium gallicum bv. gallicum R602sp TaxID=1041138 RepID=A0A0B4X5T2_9HYPH|nr:MULTISPECIES: alpha/beta hydrolase [Rhizobium]AJD42055.1 alpha/beta hydrolase family protein [Rhizobium gallicum bv. gallicum R602sp]NNH33843.1 alpha/beta hydrolase [Rhizobium sp. SEMIA 4085]
MSTIKTALSTAVILAASALGAAADPVLEPATQKFIDALAGSKPIYTFSPAEARNILAGAQKGEVKKPAVHEENRTVKAGPTGSIKLRIIRPENAKGALPVVMYFHGGGWVLGDADTHDRLVREIANGANAAVVFVDYERSPEARYPIAIEQAYAATKYVVEHANEFKVDASRVAVAGDSVGGNMTAAVTLLAKERGGPALKQQVLFYPVTDANFETRSYNQFANGPWLTKEAMKWFWNAYLPDEAKRKDPTATPLNASLEQLNGLPPALIVTDENDVLRDEGEAYGRKLSQAGVKVTSVRYNGTIHDFVLLNAISETPAVRSAITLASDTLRSALHK